MSTTYGIIPIPMKKFLPGSSHKPKEIEKMPPKGGFFRGKRLLKKCNGKLEKTSKREKNGEKQRKQNVFLKNFPKSVDIA